MNNYTIIGRVLHFIDEPDLVINGRSLERAVSNSLDGQRTTAALLGALIVLVAYALIGGRMYCSWVCPIFSQLSGSPYCNNGRHIPRCRLILILWPI